MIDEVKFRKIITEETKKIIYSLPDEFDPKLLTLVLMNSFLSLILTQIKEEVKLNEKESPKQLQSFLRDIKSEIDDFFKKFDI